MVMENNSEDFIVGQDEECWKGMRRHMIREDCGKASKVVNTDA